MRVELTTDLKLMPRLGVSGDVTPLSWYDFMACTETTLFLLGVAKVDCLEYLRGKCSS